MKNFLKLSVLSLFLISCVNKSKTEEVGSLTSKGKADSPNIIVILVDDAGYADFGFMGSTEIATPKIDQLAENSVKFSNGYVSGSVCSPSRAGLLTGRNQSRFGHEFNLTGFVTKDIPKEDRGLPVGEVTIGNMLQEVGYKTSIIGKWHLGEEDQFHPNNRGFDEFFGMLGGHSTYYAGEAHEIVSNYKKFDYKELPYLTDAFGDEAVDYVSRNKDNKFFLYLSFNAPHTPVEAKKELHEKYMKVFKDPLRAAYAAMTESVDDNVGKLIDQLKKDGTYDNTLIFFTNDNGGALPYNASNNLPLHGTKGTLKEGGIRVPFFVHWPKGIKEKGWYDEMVSSLDIVGTSAAVAGLTLPEDKIYDGVNIIPFINKEQEGKPHESLFWKGNWASAIRVDDYKLIRLPNNEYRMYDLSKDITEENNLVTVHTTDKWWEKEQVPMDLKFYEMFEAMEAYENEMAKPAWPTNPEWIQHTLMRYDQKVVSTFIKN